MAAPGAAPGWRVRAAAFLEAFTVGDAMGMPTEFMTRDQIRAVAPGISGLLPPALSRHHSDLPAGSVTDDSEQLLCLVEAYRAAGRVDEQLTTRALLDWIRRSDAVARRYIGPSSLKALNAIAAGADPGEAGKSGTTCGGIMRSPAAVLCLPKSADEASLAGAIRCCLLPTHNTSQALEAACAYGFALRRALASDTSGDAAGNDDAVAAAALRGAEAGLALAPYRACAASSGRRIAHLMALRGSWPDDAALLDHLYGVLGTGLESADVCAAVFGLYLHCAGDAWRAIRLAAELGGDTDTVAALAGGLCAAAAGGHGIPQDVLRQVAELNRLDCAALADSLHATPWLGRAGD